MEARFRHLGFLLIGLGEAMGLVISSFSVASIAGVPLGLMLATTYSWYLPIFIHESLNLGFSIC